MIMFNRLSVKCCTGCCRLCCCCRCLSLF